MKVVVCVKQIPDPNTTGQLDPTTHLLKREGSRPFSIPAMSSVLRQACSSSRLRGAT